MKLKIGSGKMKFIKSDLNRDIDKMWEYYHKGSNPKQLARTVKDLEKARNRYAIAKAMNWKECELAFRNRLEELGLTDEEISRIPPVKLGNRLPKTNVVETTETVTETPVETPAEKSERTPSPFKPYYDDEKQEAHTGLRDKGEYHEIIRSVVGQIYDGIGEGSGRESKIFQYYYRVLDYISCRNDNGEFVVNVHKFDIEQLIRCIWRIAQIERNDNGTSNKDIWYEYLDADWKSICALNAALKAVLKSSGLYSSRRIKSGFKVQFYDDRNPSKVIEEIKDLPDWRTAFDTAEHKLDTTYAGFRHCDYDIIPDTNERSTQENYMNSSRDTNISLSKLFSNEDKEPDEDDKDDDWIFENKGRR